MALSASVILVCVGADTIRASAHGHPLLDLCYTVDTHGTLTRVKIARAQNVQFVGLRDLIDVPIPTEHLISQLLYELKRLKARGLFADLENNAPEARLFCTALDQALHTQGIPLFVPISRADDTQHAILTVETAISGGSLTERMEQLQQQYGKDRIAALLRPVSADFTLPATSPDGVSLTQEARERLRAQHDAQVFFSKELCAKYFTYMDEDAHGHFVLFDDASTLEDKMRQLSHQGIRYFFALYPDISNLL